MFLLIVGSIVALAGVIALIVSFTLFAKRSNDPYSDEPGMRLGTRGVGAIAVLLGGVLVATSFINYVPPRYVGVETVWGQYERTLESGVHAAVPWSKVETFPTTFQESAPDVGVGFKGGSKGTQPVKAQWTITGDKAQALWERFKTFDQTNAQLIDNAINEETVKVFRDKTPAEVVNEDGVAEQMREDVQTAVTERLEPYGVTVDSLAFYSAVRPDEEAQGNIQQVQKAQADYDRSEIRLQTAENEAQADEIRNRESSPESIALECLEITNQWDVNKNGGLPATWNCVGGDAGGILVNSNK